jgi:hypothetical protein
VTIPTNILLHFDVAGVTPFPDPDRPPESMCGRPHGATTPYRRDVTCPRCLDLLELWDQDEEPDINDEPPPDYGPPGTGAVITEYLE